MNYKNAIIFSLLAAIVIVVGCSSAPQPKLAEPSYEGRGLGDWLRDFDNFNLPPKQKSIAIEAIRRMGPDAVPFLVERLSESQLKETKLEMKKWQKRQAAAVFNVVRPQDPRREALAALDALGPAAVTALPALAKLVNEDPPDTQALYIAARIGPAGVPLLTYSLTNENKLVRLQAQICLDMINSHSEVLYPKNSVGLDSLSFESRWCQVNLLTLKAAVKEYKANHPVAELPDDLEQISPPASSKPARDGSNNGNN